MRIGQHNWKVTEFDENTLYGVVTSISGRRFRFHSTSFQSDTSFRWPRVGEGVHVAFNKDGELLSVHGD